MNTTNDDLLLREVDEALRRDRIMAQWKRYQRPVLFGVAAIIVFMLGMTQWRSYLQTQAGKAMQQFAAGQTKVAEGNFSEAATIFAGIAEHTSTHELADLARLWQARALVGAEKKADAVALLDALANHPRSHQHMWRDLACLRLVALDESKAGCLATPDASPLAAQRTLVRAAIAWNADNSDEARRLLETLLNNPDTPVSVRDSAQRYMAVVAPAKPISPATKG